MEDCRYFIVKVASIEALQRCANSGIWACRDRMTPPHPRTVLSSALQASRVILIYSVNNCHGWHGYAEMLDAPQLDRTQGINFVVDKDVNQKLESVKSGHLTGERFEIDVKFADFSHNNLIGLPDKEHETKDFTSVNDQEAIPASKVLETKDSFNNLADNIQTSSQPKHRIDEKVLDSCSSLENQSINKSTNENISDPRTQSNLETNTIKGSQPSSNVWYHFPVKWKVCFIKEFGEQCLSSKLTEHLKVSDTMFLNKTRNWQEVPAEVGATVCSLIDQFFKSLCEKRQLQAQKLLDKQADPFFKVEDDERDACEETWRKIVDKIEGELGQVILACPFGSQRYNLSVSSSDTDMFIVYQARTKDLLGFHPPKQTIKNSERESCDYTIHEAYRYAELLLSGDARCVETLFLHESTVVKSSQQLEQLKAGRHHFLTHSPEPKAHKVSLQCSKALSSSTRETLNKYLRDAQGTRGTKQLKRWCDENPSVTVLPLKMCKLLYVIVRLLQNARDIVQGKELCVFRENDSADRATLMTIRQGETTVENAWEIIRNLESEIEKNKHKVPEKHKDTELFLEDWLINLRKCDFLDQTL